jgi:hypothetical protein
MVTFTHSSATLEESVVVARSVTRLLLLFFPVDTSSCCNFRCLPSSTVHK